MGETLSIGVRQVGDDVAIVDIAGEVTADAEDDLTEAFTSGADGRRLVALNFEDLDYMNSGGIGLLVTTLIRANRNGQRLVAFGLSEHYRQIFNLTRLDEAIVIYDTEDLAVTSIDTHTS